MSINDANGSLLLKTGRLVRSASRGAASVAKTSLLRHDRTTPLEHAARLDVCRDCPGGHATFRDNGALHTCGPMIAGMAGSGGGSDGKPGKPCGCVLSRKALDRGEDCPFGYWPTIERKPVPVKSLEPADTPTVGDPDDGAPRREQRPAARRRSPGSGPGLATPDRRLWTPAAARRRDGRDALLGVSRRRFLTGSAAALVGAAFTPRVLGAAKKYAKVTACSDGTTIEWADCDDLINNGYSVGDLFRSGTDCYTVGSETAVGKTPITIDDGPITDCAACLVYKVYLAGGIAINDENGSDELGTSPTLESTEVAGTTSFTVSWSPSLSGTCSYSSIEIVVTDLAGVIVALGTSNTSNTSPGGAATAGHFSNCNSPTITVNLGDCPDAIGSLWNISGLACGDNL